LPGSRRGLTHFAYTKVVQASQTETATINYTDGASSVFQQNFSDWFSPQNFPLETLAVGVPYRDIFDRSRDDRTFNLCAYRFVLNRTKTIQSFTPSSNREVIMLAATLTEEFG
jgi:hypothetical protein